MRWFVRIEQLVFTVNFYSFLFGWLAAQLFELHRHVLMSTQQQQSVCRAFDGPPIYYLNSIVLKRMVQLSISIP